MSKKKVAYFYDQDIGSYYYGSGHPMKPHRIRLTHALVSHYGIINDLDIFKIRKAEKADLTKFHSPEYINFLQKIKPSNKDKLYSECRKFNVGEDCPAFDGLLDYCRTYAGGSIAGAIKLNYQAADVVINWSGGLHHAKKSEASGFCYVNDIVLAILELLKYHRRVLYVDIDIHHGDGVEEAFLTTDRVFTLSFHKFEEGFFPGTGNITHVGQGRGKYYALNVPLKDGITDACYESLFKPILDKVMQLYQPEVVVIQSGADSLAGDRLGAFNLTMKGHSACQQHVLSYGLPTLVLGGGGYKISNVARCWAYETGCIVGRDVGDTLPVTEYQEYFGTSDLHIPVRADLENKNTPEYLDNIRTTALQHLSLLGSAPSTSFQQAAPSAMEVDDIVSLRPKPLWNGKRMSDEGEEEPPSKVLKVDQSFRHCVGENYQEEAEGTSYSPSGGPDTSEKGSELDGSVSGRSFAHGQQPPAAVTTQEGPAPPFHPVVNGVAGTENGFSSRPVAR